MPEMTEEINMAETILTTTEVAAELGTDPKTLRKFFRSDKCDVVPVGQGKRYAITQKQAKKLKEAFDAWHKSSRSPAKSKDEAEAENQPEAKKTTRRGRKTKEPEPVIEELDDVDEELDDDEPSEEDLTEVEDELSLDDDEV